MPRVVLHRELTSRLQRFNQLAAGARRYASTESSSQKSSNLPLILGGAGAF